MTPWARVEMPLQLRARIDAAEPTDYLVSLGRSRYGWTCRILTPDMHLVGEAFHRPTMAEAFDVAQAGMRETA